ncbi:MAG: LysR family transcriptional regulator [Rhodobacteraceae bacterium]|nr:LysR family transcriptional regulator [Paracoccaceae bacterium]
MLELIDRHGSLRAIADALNLTQPAVSQMLKDLEATFGVTLVERSVRGVRLSPSGRIALQRVRAALAILGNLASDLGENRPRVLRVGANPALLERFLPAALALVTRQEAGVQYQLRTGTVGRMLGQLLEGGVDCYVGRVDWTDPDSDLGNVLRITPLGQSDLVLVCGPDHPLARQAEVTAADLALTDWALQGPTSTLRPTVDTMFRSNGLAPPVPLCEVAGGPHEMIRLAQRLDVVVCVPRLAVLEEIAQGQLHVLEVAGMEMAPIGICFVTLRENDAFQPLKHLRDAMRTVMADPLSRAPPPETPAASDGTA